MCTVDQSGIIGEGIIDSEIQDPDPRVFYLGRKFMLTTGYNNYFNPQVLPIITTDIIIFLDDKMCFFYNKMWGGGIIH